jgi:hypothetical protein
MRQKQRIFLARLQRKAQMTTPFRLTARALLLIRTDYPRVAKRCGIHAVFFQSQRIPCHFHGATNVIKVRAICLQEDQRDANHTHAFEIAAKWPLPILTPVPAGFTVVHAGTCRLPSWFSHKCAAGPLAKWHFLQEDAHEHIFRTPQNSEAVIGLLSANG